MTKYIRIVNPVQAVQLRWTTWDEMCEMLHDYIDTENPGYLGDPNDTCGEDGPYLNLRLELSRGRVIAKHGDWIIKAENGRIDIIHNEHFHASYTDADTFNQTRKET